MGYATFTDALTQAKRNAQLRGMPFSTRDMQNLHSGYMSSAGQRNITNRQLALQGDSLSAQQNYWANQLANERDIAGMTLAQQLAIAKQGFANDYDIAAAANATNLGIAGNTNTTNTNIANNTNTTNTNISNASIAANQAIAAQQADAANKASQNQLTGNIATATGALGGAYLLSGSKPVAGAIQGVKGLFNGGSNAPTGPQQIPSPTGDYVPPGGYDMTPTYGITQPDPSLTPSGTQPLQASQTVNAPPSGYDIGGNSGAHLAMPGEDPNFLSSMSDGGGGSSGAGISSNVTPDPIGSEIGGGAPADAGAGSAGTAASALGIVKGAHLVRNMYGEGDKDYDDKSFVGKMTNSPVAMTSNPVAWLGAAFGTDLGGKESSRLENEYIGKPMDWLFNQVMGGASKLSERDMEAYNQGYQKTVDRFTSSGRKAPTPEEYRSVMNPMRGDLGDNYYPDLFEQLMYQGISGLGGVEGMEYDPASRKYVPRTARIDDYDPQLASSNYYAEIGKDTYKATLAPAYYKGAF